MAEISILSVCGSGVVTSHMVANKLVPSELDGYLTRGSYDFIAYSSPIGDDTHGVPAFSAMGLITGLGEDEFKEEALEALHAAGK